MRDVRCQSEYSLLSLFPTFNKKGYAPARVKSIVMLTTTQEADTSSINDQ